MNEGPTKHPAVRSDLLRLYQELSDHDMAPLWERLSVLVAKLRGVDINHMLPLV